MQNQTGSSDAPNPSMQQFREVADPGAASARPEPARSQRTVYHYVAHRPSDAMQRAARVARSLGWFSIGLGLAQLLAPRRISRVVGVGEHPHLMRAFGARELASGVGILAQRRPAGWLWSRLAGDAMDMAMLGIAARSNAARRDRIGLVSAAVAGIAVLDLLASVNVQRQEVTNAGEEFEKSIVINRSPEACYRFWRDLEGLPRFMHHLESVQVRDQRRSHWKAKGPLGFTAEWEADLTTDEPNAFLAWCSVPGSDIEHAGSVRFEPAPGGRGTLVHVYMRYNPPGGAAGSLLAKLFGEEPSQQVDEDLRRFKWLIESGEIPTTVGQSAGARGTLNRLLFRKGVPG